MVIATVALESPPAAWEIVKGVVCGGLILHLRNIAIASFMTEFTRGNFEERTRCDITYPSGIYVEIPILPSRFNDAALLLL